ncbi:alpha/beta hydrolase [bacterium]|nr:alpha/beta hydrolase [bacterium]
MIRVFFPNPRIFRWIKLDFNSPDVRDGIHNFMPDADLDDPEVQQAIRDFRMPVKMFAQIHRAGQLAYQNAPKIRTRTLIIQGKAIRW